MGALCNLRIRDIDFSESAGEFTVRNLPGNKDAEGTRPFTWVRGPLVNWLDVHPFRDDGDAPLFSKRTREAAAENGPALSTSAVRQMLYATARRADLDIDRERVQPTTGATRRSPSGNSTACPTNRSNIGGFHTEDSDMLSRYGPIDDQEMNESILKHYDLADGNVAQTPDIEQCNQCGTAIREGARFCPTCGLAFDEEACDRLDSFTSEVRERTVTEDNRGRRETLLKLAAVADADPADVEALLSEN